jgi:tRNA G18 (ribose-2'-O)-methylase SpoU
MENPDSSKRTIQSKKSIKFRNNPGRGYVAPREEGAQEDRRPRKDYNEGRPSEGRSFDRKPGGFRGNKDRSDAPYRGDRSERPARSEGGRPAWGDRSERPARSEGGRPAWGDRSERPPRSEGGKPAWGDRNSRPPRSEGGKPAWGDRSERPAGNRFNREDGERKSYNRDGGFERKGKRDFSKGDSSFGRKPIRFDDKPRAGFKRENAESVDFNLPRPSHFRKTRGPADAAQTEHEQAQQVEVSSWMKSIQSLQHEKGREKEQKFLAEGARCVLEIVLHSKEALERVLVDETFEDEETLSKIKAAGVSVQVLTSDESAQIAATVTTQGIYAICTTSAMKPKWETARLVTLVDSVQDPGNLGTVFRTSLAFGFDGLVLGKGCADPFNPKVVRGSSGTFLRMPFEAKVDIAERIHFLRAKGFTIVGTSPHATQRLDQVSLKKRVAILVGNEGSGADQNLLDICDYSVKIPMSADVESFNVAVSHGIMSFQLVQQQTENFTLPMRKLLVK